LRESYEKRVQAEARRTEERAAKNQSSHVGASHPLYRTSADNPLRAQPPDDPGTVAAPQPNPARAARANGRAGSAFRDSTGGPPFLGGSIDRRDQLIEERRAQALQQYEEGRQQAQREDRIYSENPHGLTNAQRRRYRDEGIQARGLGYGEEVTAPIPSRRVLR